LEAFQVRLPYYSEYRSTFDAVELPATATVCLDVRVTGGPTIFQSERGDVVNLGQPLLVPIQALADYLNSARLRKGTDTNFTKIGA